MLRIVHCCARVFDSTNWRHNSVKASEKHTNRRDAKGKRNEKVVKAPKTTESSHTTPARTLTNRHDEIVIIHKNWRKVSIVLLVLTSSLPPLAVTNAIETEYCFTLRLSVRLVGWLTGWLTDWMVCIIIIQTRRRRCVSCACLCAACAVCVFVRAQPELVSMQFRVLFYAKKAENLFADGLLANFLFSSSFYSSERLCFASVTILCVCVCSTRRISYFSYFDVHRCERFPV